MPGPMLDSYKNKPRYYNDLNPVNFERRLRASAITFAEHNPCLLQVWHFLYRLFQLQWRTYDIFHVDVDGTTETTVNAPLTNVVYETRVSIRRLRSHNVCTHIFTVGVGAIHGTARAYRTPRLARPLVFHSSDPPLVQYNFCKR